MALSPIECSVGPFSRMQWRLSGCASATGTVFGHVFTSCFIKPPVLLHQAHSDLEPVNACGHGSNQARYGRGKTGFETGLGLVWCGGSPFTAPFLRLLVDEDTRAKKPLVAGRYFLKLLSTTPSSGAICERVRVGRQFSGHAPSRSCGRDQEISTAATMCNHTETA